MTARPGARIAAWSLRVVLVLGSAACGAAPAPPRHASAPGPGVPAAMPSTVCGPWSVGQPWPTPIPAGGVDTIQSEGTLEGMRAGTALLAACGDHVALVSCSVSFRAEESPFGHDVGTHVVERPVVAAAELVARIRAHLARDGFEETWAGGGTVPQLEALAEGRRGQGAATGDDLRMGAIDAAFLAAGGARGASVASRRGEDERIVVVGCGAVGRCTVMVMESREACDAPGGLDGARLEPAPSTAE